MFHNQFAHLCFCLTCVALSVRAQTLIYSAPPVSSPFKQFCPGDNPAGILDAKMPQLPSFDVEKKCLYSEALLTEHLTLCLTDGLKPFEGSLFLLPVSVISFFLAYSACFHN